MKVKNVVLIVLDTLREDFGSVFWEDLKKLGFIKYRAVAPSFWTLPSHISMFTGLYPSAHGIHEGKEKNWESLYFDKTLPNIFNEIRRYSLTPYWLTANVMLTPTFGFPEMDFFYTPPHSDAMELFKLSEDERKYKRKKVYPLKSRKEKLFRMLKDGRFTLLFKLLFNRYYKVFRRKFINWPVDKGAKDIFNKLVGMRLEQPFFIFINLMEVHGPWKGIDLKKFQRDREDITLPLSIYLDIDSDTRKKFKKKFYKAYAEEVQYLRSTLKKIVMYLLDYDPLIIITSDHGEVLAEYDFISHFRGPKEELVRVPLFIRYPNELTTSGKGVVSLCKMPVLMKNFLNNDLRSDNFLFSKVAFSEGFGTIFVSLNPRTEVDKKLVSRFSKHRVSVVSEDSYLSFNVDDNAIEDFRGKDSDKKMLLDAVKNFIEFF